MKRKRGPVSRERNSKPKKAKNLNDTQILEEESDSAHDDEESFKGFSESDVEDHEEMHEGDNDEVEAAAPVNGKSNGVKKKGKQPAPTQEELTELLYQSSSFQSNLFKLQVDELLSETRVKYDKMEKLESFLHQLKKILEPLPATEEQLLHAFEAEMKTKHQIRVPFPRPLPPKDALYKYRFQAPTSIKLVGSYALKALAKHPEGISIDIAVTMPDAIFQEKDFRDHRYFYKRACYLTSLALGIKASNLPVYLTFEFLHGDERKPILVLTPVKDGNKHDFSKTKARIRILPTISPSLFPPSKLHPSRCNLHSSPDTPTPLYNTAIQTDSTYLHFLKQLYGTSQTCHSFTDASLLGRIWLRQRGFSSSYGHGGFGNFEWTWFVSYLLREGRPNGRPVLDSHFSSFQLFRGGLNALATKDYVNGDDVECLDGESGVNVFYKMTLQSYKLLQDEAARTLKILNDSPDDVFNAIFMTKLDIPVLRYDIAARITIPNPEDKLNADAPSNSFSLIKRTNAILQQGLTTRIKLISVITSDNTSIPITSTKITEPAILTLGVQVDPEASRRIVDYGPPSSDATAAAAFRAFWGDKAELRRFKDGSILESVVWNVKHLEDRYGIVKRIIRYVLARHISAGVAGDIVFLTPTLYPQIAASREITETWMKVESNPFQTLYEAFERFSKDLKDLKDLPLNISAVVSVAEGLTRTSVTLPQPQNFDKLGSQNTGSYYVPVHEVVIQLEGSGRWPDDLRAIQKVKIGMLLRIGKLLETAHPSVVARVGLENTDLDIANTGFLDVVYQQGYAFRARIQHDPNHREAQLIERILKNKTLQHSERTRYELALKAYQTYFMRGVQHAQAINALRGNFYFLPDTIRLVKRWLAAHLLSSHLSYRTIELLVTYVFVHHYPWDVPSSAEVGFLRTLYLLSTWNWREEPLIVDLDGSMNSTTYEEASKAFQAIRRQDPGIAHSAWCIFTSHDTTGSFWTKERPAKGIAARVTGLAKSSLDVIYKDSSNVKQLFITPLSEYDLIIQLKKDYTIASTPFKNLQGRSWKDVQIGFDPVRRLLDDLETCFGDTMLWFSDAVGGNAIAGFWNPHVTSARPWKIALGYSTLPTQDSEKLDKPLVTLNKRAVVNEIARLGGGLITSINTKEK